MIFKGVKKGNINMIFPLLKFEFLVFISKILTSKAKTSYYFLVVLRGKGNTSVCSSAGKWYNFVCGIETRSFVVEQGKERTSSLYLYLDLIQTILFLSL